MEEIENIFIKTEPQESLEEETTKPKKKRVLTEKQKKALQDGRIRAKAKREKERTEKEKQQKTSQELKKEQRELKKKLTQRQSDALEKVRKREGDKKKLEDWEEKKGKILETMPDEASFITLNNYLDHIKPEDVLNEQKLKYKLAVFAKHLHGRSK